MSEVKIFHNPRCSKSRQTLELLRQRRLDVEVVEYLKDPPTAEQLAELAGKLGMEPLEFMRTREKRFSELGLSPKDARTPAEWFKIMSKNPILIERPIVVKGKRAALGRPPEKVLGIL